MKSQNSKQKKVDAAINAEKDVRAFIQAFAKVMESEASTAEVASVVMDMIAMMIVGSSKSHKDAHEGVLMASSELLHRVATFYPK